MKKALLALALTLATGAYAQTSTVELRMDDMHCRKCANRISGKLEGQPGIDSMKANIGNHYMTISYDAGKTSPAAIRETITQTGYTPVSYYESRKAAYAYFLIPAEQATAATVSNAMTLSGVSDASVNARRKSLAVTYLNDLTTEERLLADLQQAGIQAVLPKPHVCTEGNNAK